MGSASPTLAAHTAAALSAVCELVKHEENGLVPQDSEELQFSHRCCLPNYRACRHSGLLDLQLE